MTRRKQRIIGVSVIVALLALLIVFLAIRFGSGGTVTVLAIGDASAVSNLTTRTEVRYRDTSIGHVSAITSDGACRTIVSLKVRKMFKDFIRSDSIVTVKKQFMIAGDAYLDISCGKGEPLNTTARLPLIQDRELDRETKRAINKIARAVVAATDETNSQPTFATFQQELRKQAHNKASEASTLKQPDQDFYSILNGLDEDSLDDEVVDSPKVFIKKYLPVIVDLVGYDISNVSGEHRRVFLALFNNVGTAFGRLGYYEYAIIPLEKAVIIEPGEPVCRRNLALALKRSGMKSHDWKLLERSLDEYKTVIKIEKDKASDLKSEAERSIAEINSFQKTMWSTNSSKVVHPDSLTEKTNQMEIEKGK